MKLIESKTIATAVATVEFTSIPQTYTDLVILISSRAGVGDGNGITTRPNGSTTSATSRQLYGTGSSATSNSFSAISSGFTNGSTETANTFSSSYVYIPNYTSSTNKSFSTDSVMENNATQAFHSIVAGLWSNTSAITSLSFVTSDAGNFAVGTIFSLYGVLKGTDGIVTTSP